MANLFDLLDLADGESGDAAVSVLVAKRKTEAAAAARRGDDAGAASPAHEKPAPKNVFFTKLQFDNGVRICQQELKRLREVLIKLRQEETTLKAQVANGKDAGGRLEELSQKQRNLRQEQRRLREEEARLEPQRKLFYQEHGFYYGDDKAAHQEEEFAQDCCKSSGGVSNANGNDYKGGNGHGQYQHGHDEEQGVEEGRAYYNGGGRQGYRGQPRMKKEYRPKVKASSDAGAEAEPKPEEKVSSDGGTEEAEHKPDDKVSSAGETEQKEATAASSDTVPASESEQSAGDAANNGRNNGQAASGNRKFVPKQKLNGSEKRKLRNSKKRGGNGVEKAKTQDSEMSVPNKQTTDKEPQSAYVGEAEKTAVPSASSAMTLAEYEKIREEKKKSPEASKTEERKVTAEAFQGLQLLEKKKLDDEEAILKAEKVQPKGKQEARKKEEKVQPEEKDAKPKKVVISRKVLGFRQPPRQTYDEEGGSFNGRFNGGRGRYNGTESRDPGRGDSSRAAQTEAGNNDGHGAPRGGYSGGGDGAPRGDDNNVRGGFRGNGGYPRGGYNGRGNGGYHHQQGGYHQQEGAGNGGHQQQGGYPRRPAGNGNGSYYRQRGGGSAPAKEKPVEFNFPPLPAPAFSARAAAPASAPAAAAPAPASAPSSAPAEVQSQQ